MLSDASALCFQLYSIIVLSFKEIFCAFVQIFSKSSAADLLYVGKGLSVKPIGDLSSGWPIENILIRLEMGKCLKTIYVK